MKTVSYIDTCTEYALHEFSEIFYGYLAGKAANGTDICILCIGTDRATGDSLGPIVGQRLAESTSLISDVFIYGTLEAPVHAKNLIEVLDNMYARHRNPLVIAIDASLGQTKHVGYLTTGYGGILPGAGLRKKLPQVGDIFVTGIVNFSGAMDFYILQNTRLGLVMRMADIVHGGILGGLLKMKCVNSMNNS